jgi:GrpB-like predicted nucleotidyltransferase (UPF0157 family)
MFEEEKAIISKALDDNCIEIHHVGSTSVPGLSAKPKIDIVAVAKDRKSAIANLEKAGYTYKGEWNIPLKCGFTKRGATDVNLHLFFDRNHPEVELNLKFRDYLRTHPKVRDEYGAMKIKVLEDESVQQKVKEHFPIYTLKKYPFIEKVLKDIGYNRLRVLKSATEDQDKAAKAFRKKYFDRKKVADPLKDFDDPNHEHFIFYRGVEIIGYANIHVISQSKANVEIFEVSDDSTRPFFLGLIDEWIKVHDYEKL